MQQRIDASLNENGPRHTHHHAHQPWWDERVDGVPHKHISFMAFGITKKPLVLTKTTKSRNVSFVEKFVLLNEILSPQSSGTFRGWRAEGFWSLLQSGFTQNHWSTRRPLGGLVTDPKQKLNFLPKIYFRPLINRCPRLLSWIPQVILIIPLHYLHCDERYFQCVLSKLPASMAYNQQWFALYLHNSDTGFATSSCKILLRRTLASYVNCYPPKTQ